MTNRVLHRGESGVQTARESTARPVRLQRQGDLPRRCDWTPGVGGFGESPFHGAHARPSEHACGAN